MYGETAEPQQWSELTGVARYRASAAANPDMDPPRFGGRNAW